MADLDATVTINTPGGDLVIDTAPYDLVAVGWGGRSWRREVVEGRYMHGRALVGAVLDTQTLTVHVRINDDTWAEVEAAYEALADALSQWAYTVTVTVEGVTRTFECEPGDIRMVSGDTLSKFHAMRAMQDYLVTIPCRQTSGGGGS